MTEILHIQPIVSVALRELIRNRVMSFGTTGGMMMSNNEIKAYVDDIAAACAVLADGGEDIPEIRDVYALHAIERAPTLPSSDKSRSLVPFYG